MARGFQGTGFQVGPPITPGQKGFQFDTAVTLPLTSDPTGFTIDQTLHYICDQFEISFNGSQQFREKKPLADILHGLITPSGPELIEHISKGTIDEWELHGSPPNLASLVRGRDAAAAAADTTLYITYMAGGLDWRTINPQPALPTGLAAIPGVTVPIVLPGRWLASAAAANLADRVGLNVLWQADDYVLRSDFVVAGPVIAAIQTLVQPFSLFEPTKVDIWADGKTLVIRKRPGLNGGGGAPGVPVPGPLNTISVTDARVSDVVIRTRTLDNIRALRLIGAPQDAGGPGACQKIEEVTETDETRSGSDKLISRVVTTTTTRRPDNQVLKVVGETYLPDPNDSTGTFERLASRFKTNYVVDDLIFDDNCRILNHPKIRSEITEVEAFDEDEGSLQPSTKTEITYLWDNNVFMRVQDMQKFTYNSEEIRYEPNEREVRRYREMGPGKYQESVERFTAGEDTWLSIDIRKGTANGTAPGGPSYAISQNTNNTNPFVVAAVIDNVPGAKDLTVTLEHFTQIELDIVKAQAVIASGATEHEVSLTAANMSWLRRGQMIQLTGFVAEDGATAIPLISALIFECRTEFREDESPQYLSKIRCVWWE